MTEFREKKPASEPVFRKLFDGEYNLSFKRRHTDTCKTCDELNAKIQRRIIIDKTLTENEKKNILNWLKKRMRLFVMTSQKQLEVNVNPWF